MCDQMVVFGRVEKVQENFYIIIIIKTRWENDGKGCHVEREDCVGLPVCLDGYTNSVSFVLGYLNYRLTLTRKVHFALHFSF